MPFHTPRPTYTHSENKTKEKQTNYVRGAGSFLRSCQSLSYSRISQHFMEPEGSLPYSQQSSTGPYPEPDQSSPYHPYRFKIRFNIILPPKSIPSQLSLSFWLSHYDSTCIPLLPHACYIPSPSQSNYTWRRVKVTKLFIRKRTD
jgi:hypothetical protein